MTTGRAGGWSNAETRVAAEHIRAVGELRDEVTEQINALANDQSLGQLTAEAASVVRAAVEGRWHDYRQDPRASPAYARALFEHLVSVERVDWQQLGEAFLFEVGTTGAISAG